MIRIHWQKSLILVDCSLTSFNSTNFEADENLIFFSIWAAILVICSSYLITKKYLGVSAFCILQPNLNAKRGCSIPVNPCYLTNCTMQLIYIVQLLSRRKPAKKTYIMCLCPTVFQMRLDFTCSVSVGFSTVLWIFKCSVTSMKEKLNLSSRKGQEIPWHSYSIQSARAHKYFMFAYLLRMPAALKLELYCGASRAYAWHCRDGSIHVMKADVKHKEAHQSAPDEESEKVWGRVAER